MSYLKWVSSSGRPDRESWHVLERVDDRGWHLRCGKTITTDKAEARQVLPAGEKTCESCLAGAVRDQDPAPVANDPVLEPPDVENDPVPG